MTLYLVTVKLPRNPDHDPLHKVTGTCPVNGAQCTDITGQHHTFTMETDKGIDYIVSSLSGMRHITRVEEA